MRPQAIALAIATTAICPSFAASSSSAPSVVWLNPAASLMWKTVVETPIPVSVDWPDDAQSARITASAGSRTLADQVISDKSVLLCRLPVSFPKSESDECILTLNIDFMDGSGDVLPAHSRSANVALVRGVSGNSFRCIPAGSSARAWKSAGNDGNAVVPVPRGTTALSLDGISQEIGTPPGWFWLSNLAVGSHTLAKTDENSERMEVRLTVGLGMVFIVW